MKRILLNLTTLPPENLFTKNLVTNLILLEGKPTGYLDVSRNKIQPILTLILTLKDYFKSLIAHGRGFA
jgi:hypothetical protein